MSFSEFNKTEVLSHIFSYYINIILEVNQKKTNCKSREYVQDKNTLEKKKVTEEIKEEIKKYLETNENKNMMIQNSWDTA